MGRFHRDDATFGVERHPVVVDVPGASERSFVQALIAPGSVFGHPGEIVHHPWFTDEEKRAVLASWARDELVIEHTAQNLRPEKGPVSRMDSVIQALARFDASAAGEYLSAARTIRVRQARSSRNQSQVHVADRWSHAPLDTTARQHDGDGYRA
jgi:hypothetical protein